MKKILILLLFPFYINAQTINTYGLRRIDSLYSSLVATEDTTLKPVVMGADNKYRKLTYWPVGGGTATSPAGSNTQIQYNNSGAFGGASNITTNGTWFNIGNVIGMLENPRLLVGNGSAGIDIEYKGNGFVRHYLIDQSQATNKKIFQILNLNGKFSLDRINDANTAGTRFFEGDETGVTLPLSSGTGNKLAYLDANGKVVRSDIDPSTINSTRLQRVLHRSYTDASMNSTTETDLNSYTVPANTFAVDGDALDITYTGQFLTGNQQYARVLFAGTEIGINSASDGVPAFYRVTARIIRTSSTTVRVEYSVLGPGLINNILDIGSLNFAAGLVLKISATSQGGPVTHKSATVEFKPYN